jgi:hypothetical protein
LTRWAGRCRVTLSLTAGRAFMQIEIPADVFPPGHGPDNVLAESILPHYTLAATSILGPDGDPPRFHVLFDYDGLVEPWCCRPHAFTIQAGACLTTLSYSGWACSDPCFPVLLIPPPFISLCACWPYDPDCPGVPPLPVDDLVLEVVSDSLRLSWSAPEMDVLGNGPLLIEGYEVYASPLPWFLPTEETRVAVVPETGCTLPLDLFPQRVNLRVVCLGALADSRP